MLRPIDQYFLEHPEPVKSCLQFLREYILEKDNNIMEVWRYQMPFFCYKGKRFCYLWVHKKYKQPYIGIVEGNKILAPELIAEKRLRMKILLLDAWQDLPMKKIGVVLEKAITLCR